MFDTLTMQFTAIELQEHFAHDVACCKICSKLENLKRHVKFISPRKRLYQ